MTDEQMMALIERQPPEGRWPAAIMCAFAKAVIAAGDAYVALRDVPALSRGLTDGLYTLSEDDAGRFILTYNDPFAALPVHGEEEHHG